MDFQLNRRTAICCCTHSDAAENAVRILNRDIEKCLTAFDKENRIILNEDNSLGFEEYRIEVGDDIRITATDEPGDNIRHDLWYRKAVYEPEDREVFSLLVLDNHMTDWELYEAFKIKL